MKLTKWETPFRNKHYLYCESIISNGESELNITLVQYHPVKEQESKYTGLPKHGDGTPISKTKNSNSWLIHFKKAVAFRSESESCFWRYSNIEKEGNCFTVTGGEWYKDNSEFIHQVHPGLIHYLVFTNQSAVEVLAAEQPIVT